MFLAAISSLPAVSELVFDSPVKIAAAYPVVVIEARDAEIVSRASESPAARPFGKA